MSEPKLTRKQSAFIDEYLVDLNGTQAAIRAGYSAKTAYAIATENLKKPYIQEALSKRMAKRAEKVNITVEMVLARWWQIATQDVNELVQFKRVGCSHCHEGDATATRHSPPNPDCPNCEGQGVGFMHVADTRKLSPGALSIYRGIVQTKEGLRVEMADQDKALEHVARHLGMFKDASTIDLTTGGRPIDSVAAITDEQLEAAIKRVNDAV